MSYSGTSSSTSVSPFGYREVIPVRPAHGRRLAEDEDDGPRRPGLVVLVDQVPAPDYPLST